MRLARIDAPERGEQGYREAGDVLEAMIVGREVRCELVDANPRTSQFEPRDSFGRPVARCFADGMDLQEALVAGGYARRWG